MTYNPTQWKSGDVVTSAKLNKIEEGITSGANAYVIQLDYQNGYYVMDKTWSEILTASKSGIVIAIDSYAETETSIYYVSHVVQNVGASNPYTVSVVDLGADALEQHYYTTDTENGFPKWKDA